MRKSCRSRGGPESNKGLLSMYWELLQDGQSKHIILITYILHAYILYKVGLVHVYLLCNSTNIDMNSKVPQNLKLVACQTYKQGQANTLKFPL